MSELEENDDFGCCRFYRRNPHMWGLWVKENGPELSLGLRPEFPLADCAAHNSQPNPPRTHGNARPGAPQSGLRVDDKSLARADTKSI